MNVRAQLIAALKAAAGPTVDIITVEDNQDVLDRVTLMVKQRSIVRLPEAPPGSLRIEYVVSVVHPATDAAVSEPALDGFVPELMAELDRHSWLGWTNASKILDGSNLGYDVEIYVIAGPKGEAI